MQIDAVTDEQKEAEEENGQVQQSTQQDSHLCLGTGPGALLAGLSELVADFLP